MALIVLVMAIVGQAFTTALAAFRELKATGDLQERLREAATQLREDLDSTDRFTRDFLLTSAQKGAVEGESAATLRDQYEAIATEADRIAGQLRVLERQTTDRTATPAIRRSRDTLEAVELHSRNAVAILSLHDDDDD